MPSAHDFEFIGRKIRGDNDEPIAAGFAGVNFRNIAFAEMLRVYEPRRDQGIGQVPASFRISSGKRRKTALGS